jgi:peptide/nickel transport system substrate-binding protein
VDRQDRRELLSRRQLLVGGTSAVATAAVVAATRTTSAASVGEPVTGGSLRVGVIGSTNDFVDAQIIVTKADQARLVAGWETLVTYDENFELVYEHALAEEIEVVADDHYVIRLKEAIQFHNGKTVTSDDLIYSFRRRIDPELAITPSLAELLRPDGLSKVDERTVDVRLERGTITFLDDLATYASTVVPEGYARDDPVHVGTGPFVLESFTAGAESVHIRNENYWDPERPYLDEVQIVDFADSAALVNALSSGEVDVIVDLPFAQVATVASDPDLVVLESEAGSWLPITMAIDQEPFRDPRVRQAMRLIVDRDEMVQRVLSGHGRVGNDMYGVLDPCYPADFPQRVQDIEQARQLLREAGHEGLTIELFAPDDTAGLAELAAAFAEQAAEAGVTVDVRVLDGGTYWGEEYTRRTFATSFWLARPYLNQVELSGLRTAVYPETHWPPEGSNFEELYSQASAETSDAARCEIIRRMQQQQYDEGGYIIAVLNNLLDAHRVTVHGLVSRPNVLNLDHFGRGFKNIWLQH